MKIIVVLFLFYSIVLVLAFKRARILHANWKAYKLEYNKIFPNHSVDEYRHNIYLRNLRKVNEHNKLYNMHLEPFKLGINQYSDLESEEVMHLYTGVGSSNSYGRVTPPDIDRDHSYEFALPNHPFEIPRALNWVLEGAVTPIKSQGPCGACWAFAATGALEGQKFLQTGYLVSFSEQNLIDCSMQFGNDGCGGGWVQTSYAYVQYNYGLDTTYGYPYLGYQGNCKYNPYEAGAGVNGFATVPPNDEILLMEAIALVGPITALVDASQYSFHAYSGGIYYEPACTQTFNHALLIVGYGRDPETGYDYWLLKNSWGTQWGERGFMRMIRNANNHCCIACVAVYPIIT